MSGNKDGGAAERSVENIAGMGDETELSEPNAAQGAEETSTIRRHRQSVCTLLVHGGIWVVMTGWWVAGLVLHRGDIGWLIPFLVWLGLSIRLLTLHIRTEHIMKPISRRWAKSVTPAVNGTPRLTKLASLSLLTLAVVLAGTFAPRETASNTRADRAIGLFGFVVFIAGFWVTSRDRAKINWQAVIMGVLIQFLLGLFVLRTRAGYDIFNFLGSLAKSLLGYAGDGTAFLTSQAAVSSGWFLVVVIPPMIFFVSVIHLLHYWGWIQWMVGKFAAVFFHLMGISGAEAAVAAASPFLGQGESAVLIKTFVPLLTHAELHQIMTSGFATIAGSVLSGYIALGISPLALVSSCAMSIPAAITVSKLRYPEREEPLTLGGVLRIPEDDEGGQPFNSLHALANGSWAGIKIAGMVVASVLCITALLGLVNGLLGWWGSYLDIDNLDIQLIFGYVLYPVAFLLGVERNGDLMKVAKLIGIKIVANEFVAYGELVRDAEYDSLSPRSRLIAVYAVCGFGNISAVGIQIGVLSRLAPERAGAVADVAVSALISGVFSTLTSASIAGMLTVDTRDD